MIPNDFNDNLQQDFIITQQPTLTYRLNFDGAPSSGRINRLEAMKQAIYLILNTERYQFAIYSWNYGVELENLVGESITPYLQAKVQHAIEDALLADDRILGVDSFNFQKLGMSMTVYFTVRTNQGEVDTEYKFGKEAAT